MVGSSRRGTQAIRGDSSRQQATLAESLRIGMVPKHLKFMRGTKLRRERMTQLLSSLHSWEIHAEQGQYHAWHLSISGGVRAREGFESRFAPKYRGNSSMVRQNHVGRKVALMRGAWLHDNWRDS
jgi:hypothetical protein